MTPLPGSPPPLHPSETVAGSAPIGQPPDASLHHPGGPGTLTAAEHIAASALMRRMARHILACIGRDCPSCLVCDTARKEFNRMAKVLGIEKGVRA